MPQAKFAREVELPIAGPLQVEPSEEEEEEEEEAAPKPGSDPRAVTLPKPEESATIDARTTPLATAGSCNEHKTPTSRSGA